MFGFGKEGRAAEALRRGTRAILIGGFFHVDHAEEFGLNEVASAWLYTEAIAHQIYVLFVIFHNTLGKDYAWATAEFAAKCVSETMAQVEAEQDDTPGRLESVVFPRCGRFDQFSGAERKAGKHFVDSAEQVHQHDSRANIDAMAARLQQVAEGFFDRALPMFK